jgi:hypothetical protein
MASQPVPSSPEVNLTPPIRLRCPGDTELWSRYVSPGHLKLTSWKRFSRELRKLGIDASRFLGPRKLVFEALRV